MSWVSVLLIVMLIDLLFSRYLSIDDSDQVSLTSAISFKNRWLPLLLTLIIIFPISEAEFCLLFDLNKYWFWLTSISPPVRLILFCNTADLISSKVML